MKMLEAGQAGLTNTFVRLMVVNDSRREPELNM
jgi:hypothetical protein